ncbi:MAG TPA: mevalonate kinase [Gammaproteobacteria bacterium]|nr:mevalonate kinase [Gammaproteobacteria bacterium]
MSSKNLFQASAPGSLFLLGEYAVLYNKPALVCALDKRMTVTLTPRTDEEVELRSEGYGCFRTSLTKLAISAPFQFVSACLYLHRKKLKSGCDIHITSEFSDQVGFGSSAAVTVATLAALFSWLGLPLDHLSLIREARQVVREVQTLGSGADVAASVMGGIVAYRALPLAVEKFSLAPPLTVIYSGSKTPTVEALKRVREKFATTPALFNKLCQAIHQCAKEGIAALEKADWQRLGSAMNVQQGLMQALGVSTPLLEDLIERLRADPAICGAKISGSGWGDCVIGLGRAEHLGLEERYQGVKQIAVQVAEEGVSLQ